MKDQQLVKDFLEVRSEHAFKKLYRDKTPHLFRMALRLTQDEHLSEELIQEVWIVAIRKLPDFEWKCELKTWLISILINLFRSHRKANEKRSLSNEEISNAKETHANDWDGNAYDLEQAIGQLPPGYRQIIVLHDVEGYKHHEIAEILDISIGTSKSQLFHARKAIRSYLNTN